MESKTNFSNEYIQHLLEPQNYGVIKNFSAKGIAKNSTSNELVEMYLDIKDNLISDIKYQAIGCTTTVVGASLFTSTIKGESIDESLSVVDDILKKLKEADAKERVCGEMVAKSFLAAIENFNTKKETIITLIDDCPTL